MDDLETVISSYLQQTSLRTPRLQRGRLGDVDTGSEDTEILIPLSEVITTPLISETDDIHVRIIDFGVCRLYLSCLSSQALQSH